MNLGSLYHRLRRRTRIRLLPRLAERRMQGGYLLELRPRLDSLERQMYFARTYEPATLALIDRLLRPGDTMVDVGANLGLMTLHASRRVGMNGRVVAIEPHPAYFPRLLRHLAMNHADNVTPVNVAAGATPGMLPIFDVPDVNIGRSSLVLPAPDARPAGDTEVRRLDDILAALGTGPVRLVKIDVEGFEAEVLRGAPDLLEGDAAWCIECGFAMPTAGDAGPLFAYDLMMATGRYRAYRFVEGKGIASRLSEVTARDTLAGIHDNIIFIPKSGFASDPALFEPGSPSPD